jgi:hypothetical protein
LSDTSNIQNIKDWFAFAIALVACIAGIIFWVQSSNDPKFAKIESEIRTLRSEVVSIRENNQKILRIVGRLEGKLDN